MQPIITTSDENWQTLLKGASIDLRELLDLLDLSSLTTHASAEASQQFKLQVPRPYVDRMEKGNPLDPLLLQVLPQHAELEIHPGYSFDPLQEEHANPVPGLIHKYQGRVLLILSGACAINCRYCFRRHFPYSDNQLSGQHWQQVIDYISADDSITEVIFSGGDPLATTDKRLQQMIQALEKIPHITRLRIHTRLPVVIPQRVTDTLCSIFAECRLNIVCVLHINHPQEIDSHVATAMQRLQQVRVTLLNQAVLLKGINDSVSTLKNLSETLFANRVLPYYLFVLDPVVGSAHFDVDDEQAVALVKALQNQLPGYLVPKLAREIPGRPSKTLLSLS